MNVIKKNELEHYFNTVIGLDVHIDEVSNRNLQKIPLYLKHGYKFYKIDLYNQSFLLAIFQGEEPSSPKQLEKQLQLMTQMFNKQVVYAFDHLEAYQRKRLVQRRIPFVVPGKQLYFPFIPIDLNERRIQKTNKKNQLTPAAQCLIIYHLHKEPLDNISFQEIASKLNYTNMTISRVVRELMQFDLIEIFGARSKTMTFRNQRMAIWEKALPLMKNPIKKKYYATDISQKGGFLNAGISALSNYTNIDAGTIKYYAMSSDEFGYQESKHIFLDLNQYKSNYCIEIWKYNPRVLTDSLNVDPLSLYITMRDEADERIEKELENLITKQW